MDPEWAGFKRGPNGELCYNGWAVFGHILPRVTVEHFPCHASGEPVEEVGETSVVGAYTRRSLVVEWLGSGLAMAFGGTRLR